MENISIFILLYLYSILQLLLSSFIQTYIITIKKIVMDVYNISNEPE